MATNEMLIALPDRLRVIVESHVASGEYDSADEYLEHVISSAVQGEQSELQANLDFALQTPEHHITAQEVEAGGLVSLFRAKLAATR